MARAHIAATERREGCIAPEASLISHPFRPVQYLGNKLRVLDEIMDAAQSLVGDGGQICDLFTGSTVVAQAFATKGYTVTATDTQEYATTFAKALLGIGRRGGEICDPGAISRHKLSNVGEELFQPWLRTITKEERALRQRDYTALCELYARLPLMWRSKRHPSYSKISGEVGLSALGETPLMTAIYAGYYFGIRQAIELDYLRHRAAEMNAIGLLSNWQYSVALTGIMHAASKAAHTAGKHFAQPLNAGPSQNMAFLKQRLFEDRSIDISEAFAAGCAEINAHARFGREKHRAFTTEAESFVSSKNDCGHLYYLDPPYTAQQYSRFYHVLETINSYVYPQLLHGGVTTTGLYPSNRYKSAFSSKRQAQGSLRAIIHKIRQRKGVALISYSNSSINSQGNARMISLHSLLTECRDTFGAKGVEWGRMSHRYRQFNSAANANASRNDAEILIKCKII